MQALKGLPQVISAESDGSVELVRYADGSWGLYRHGRPAGVWEPAEKDDCFRIYRELKGERVNSAGMAESTR